MSFLIVLTSVSAIQWHHAASHQDVVWHVNNMHMVPASVDLGVNHASRTMTRIVGVLIGVPKHIEPNASKSTMHA
jgi:hypothetical protein